MSLGSDSPLMDRVNWLTPLLACRGLKENKPEGQSPLGVSLHCGLNYRLRWDLSRAGDWTLSVMSDRPSVEGKEEKGSKR